MLNNYGLEKYNYFRVALVSKPEINKLINALKDYSKNIFLNKILYVKFQKGKKF